MAALLALLDLAVSKSRMRVYGPEVELNPAVRASPALAILCPTAFFIAIGLLVPPVLWVYCAFRLGLAALQIRSLIRPTR